MTEAVQKKFLARIEPLKGRIDSQNPVVRTLALKTLKLELLNVHLAGLCQKLSISEQQQITGMIRDIMESA